MCQQMLNTLYKTHEPIFFLLKQYLREFPSGNYFETNTYNKKSNESPWITYF